MTVVLAAKAPRLILVHGGWLRRLDGCWGWPRDRMAAHSSRADDRVGWQQSQCGRRPKGVGWQAAGSEEAAWLMPGRAPDRRARAACGGTSARACALLTALPAGDRAGL